MKRRPFFSCFQLTLPAVAILASCLARADVTYSGDYNKGTVWPYNLVVGVTGTGSLAINNQGTIKYVNVNNDMYVGQGTGSSGTVTIDGSGAAVNDFGLLYLGHDGTGEIDVTNGGRFTAYENDVSVWGDGAAAVSILKISGGGTVSIPSIQAEALTTTISVDGTGSTLTTGLLIGSSLNATASLTVKNGADANLSGLYTTGTTATTILVDGATMQIAGAAQMYGGNSSFTASGGAAITSAGIVLDSASLLLSGTGTTWTSSGAITVASTGQASITIKDGATLDTQGKRFTLMNSATGEGTLKIGDGDAPGFFKGGYVYGETTGSGNGTLEFDHNSTGYYFTTDGTASGSAIGIMDNTQVVVTAGTTILTSSSSNYTGGTRINGGTLVAAGNSALGTGAVNVAGGTLQISKGSGVTNSITLSGGALAQGIAASASYSTLRSYHGILIGGIPTDAQIVGGQASADAMVTGAFRSTSLALNESQRISDVFSLGGVAKVNEITGQTDVFVLEMTASDLTGNSYLAWLDPDTQLWTNAVLGNFGGTAQRIIGAYNPATDFNLGTYGVDTATNTVWAVLNHNSDYAVLNSTTAAPEPSTWAMLLGGLGLLLLWRPRRC